MSIKVALFEPRIPQNTGNIGRTCAAFDIGLDLICPLGFSLEDKYLKRAGLDYWQFLNLTTHQNYHKFKETTNNSRIVGFSKSGRQSLSDISFKSNDILLFGREDLGLTDEVRKDCDLLVEIPMKVKANKHGDNGVRSLNLSVACGIACYKAVSQFE